MSIIAYPSMLKPQPQNADLAIPLLEGILSDIRMQTQFLVKCLNNHRDIDRDLWRDLADIAKLVLDETDQVLCVRCLSAQHVKLGRGRGFDAVLCDSCNAHERGL